MDIKLIPPEKMILDGKEIRLGEKKQAVISVLGEPEHIHENYGSGSWRHYYISLRKELGYDEEYNSCYPPIDHPSDVLEMISLDQMVIPDDGIYDGRCVCLAFSCSWDDENGMGIRFLNEKIDETGYQDIVF